MCFSLSRDFVSYSYKCTCTNVCLHLLESYDSATCGMSLVHSYLDMQDIANYTRVKPSQREMVFRKFVERVNTNQKV